MNQLILATLDLGAVKLLCLEETREQAEDAIHAAFEEYRKTRPAFPYNQYTVAFYPLSVGDVALIANGDCNPYYHPLEGNSERWPTGYVQCAMTQTWFDPEENPLAETVGGYWIQDPASHTAEEIAEELGLDVAAVYAELGLEQPTDE